ncbi:MAG TPA: 50S ribosomal protein L1 [Phycisphaerae bacterium]|nr:50S ribosomal protein L1 [Phycisphaerae bacterium]HUU22468.1 50S ribosomal protein L1 [Phycisphaerae bacterium]
MGRRSYGKRYREDLGKFPSAPVPVRDGVRFLKQCKPAKFDQTVELAIWLGIDPRQAEQQIRGSISLPHGIGKTKKVVAFCEDAQVAAAKEAGAVEAGGDELIKKIQDGWTDFDVAVATPSMMRSVSRLGRVLGPQGKMPSPKAGTVVEDVVTAVAENAAGKVQYRNDDGGNIHLPVGKLSFEEDKLAENVEAFLSRLRSVKPATVKGQYIKKACLSATMTPGVALAVE